MLSGSQSHLARLVSPWTRVANTDIAAPRHNGRCHAALSRGMGQYPPSFFVESCCSLRGSAMRNASSNLEVLPIVEFGTASILLTAVWFLLFSDND